MGVGRAVEGTKWPVWAGQADSCNYIWERSCPRQWKMKSISVTHGLVHKSKRGSSLSTTCKKTPKPKVFQEAQIYPVLTAGKASKHLGWFVQPCQGCQAQPGLLPATWRVELSGGKKSVINVFWEGFFSWVDGDRSAGVKLEGTLNPKLCDGACVVKCRGAMGNLVLTPKKGGVAPTECPSES